MANIFKAFGIAFVLGIAVFGILKLAGLPNSEAVKLALAPFAAIPWLDSKIEKLHRDQGTLPTLREFSLPFWKLFILATVAGFAMIAYGLGRTPGCVGVGEFILCRRSFSSASERCNAPSGLPSNLWRRILDWDSGEN